MYILQLKMLTVNLQRQKSKYWIRSWKEDSHFLMWKKVSILFKSKTACFNLKVVCIRFAWRILGLDETQSMNEILFNCMNNNQQWWSPIWIDLHGQVDFYLKSCLWKLWDSRFGITNFEKFPIKAGNTPFKDVIALFLIFQKQLIITTLIWSKFKI